MRHRTIARVEGKILLLLSAAMSACGLFAWLDTAPIQHDHPSPMWLAALATAAAAALLLFWGRGAQTDLSRRESTAIVGLSWLLATFCGALPFVLCPPYLSFAGALFEAASGFTTTGSSVIPDLSQWPRALLLWRSVMQWLGGVGILVLFVALLSNLGPGSKHLFRRESSLTPGESDASLIQETSLRLIGAYLLLSTLCLGGLAAMGMDWFEAVNYTFSAVSTGGFSPDNNSVATYADWGNAWLIELWLTHFSLMGSLNFLVLVMFLRGRWGWLARRGDVLWCVGFWLVSTLAISLGLHWERGLAEPFPAALLDAWFTVVTIGSTTGFGTVDYGQWPAWCKALLALLMLVGGCSGSTSGGLKVDRAVLFLRSSLHEITRSFRPARVFGLQANGAEVSAEAQSRVASFVALYLFLCALSVIIVGLLEAGHPIDLETCVGAVLATISNIGPGFGAVGPTGNFAGLHEGTQVFLAGLMILGRLEIFSLLALCSPALWRNY